MQEPQFNGIVDAVTVVLSNEPQSRRQTAADAAATRAPEHNVQPMRCLVQAPPWKSVCYRIVLLRARKDP